MAGWNTRVEMYMRVNGTRIAEMVLDPSITRMGTSLLAHMSMTREKGLVLCIWWVFGYLHCWWSVSTEGQPPLQMGQIVVIHEISVTALIIT